jgi:probable F420-dependent oxidoreductase
MQIGVVFPQTEIGPDGGAVRSYGHRVEELGFRHVLAYDHVLGADRAVHRGWDRPYDSATTFHEPLVMFGFLAALTSLELVTGIIILPQRQTALVAKQAAEVDLLSGGRLRLGVGLGWNYVEYEALGQDFATRGRRIEEQVALMRRLWTEPSLSHAGPFDRITGAGIAPLPVQRPIPAPSPRRPTAAPAGWPTAGSRRCSRARNWTRPAPWSARPPLRRGVTRPRSAWRAGSPGGATPASWPGRPPAGRMRAPATCPSTRWARAWPPSTTTWPRWPRRPGPCT